MPAQSASEQTKCTDFDDRFHRLFPTPETRAKILGRGYGAIVAGATGGYVTTMTHDHMSQRNALIGRNNFAHEYSRICMCVNESYSSCATLADDTK